MKKFGLALLLALVPYLILYSNPAAQCGGIQFNEFDYDQDGTDTAEFVELTGQPGLALGNFDLLFINGLNGDPYLSQPLTGTIPADGYVVVGALAVPSTDIILGTGGANLIQNGAPDAAGLWDKTNSVYCDFINYEGVVTGFDLWPDIGTDTPALCAAGASTSLARREASLPPGEWVAGACASPGSPNQSPTALKISSFKGHSERSPASVFKFLIVTSLLAVIAIARHMGWLAPPEPPQ